MHVSIISFSPVNIDMISSGIAPNNMHGTSDTITTKNMLYLA
jgi:hypothetical protein